MVASAATFTAVPAASAAAVPPRKPRRVVSIGVFVGGVLSTRSAWVIWITVLVVRVRAGAEVAASPRLAFMISVAMKKSTVPDIRKKRIGRPPVNAVPVLVRIAPAEIEPIDGWIKEQPRPKPSRPEAIRRLVELGLKAKAAKT